MLRWESERRGRTCHDKHRSPRGALSGWRAAGFDKGGGYEACDSELEAILYGLTDLVGRREVGVCYTIFTDSTAAMARTAGDATGPDQKKSIQIIELAQGNVGQGFSMAIRWIPARRGVKGKERAV